MRSMTIAGAMLWVAVAVGPADAGTVTFSDTTFATSDWNAASGPARSPWSIWASTSQLTTATRTTVSAAPALVLTHRLFSSGNAGGAIVNNAFAYTPSVSGAITALDYLVTQQWQAPYDLPWRLGIVQGGKYFATPSYHRAYEDGVPPGTYKTFAGTGLTAANFAEQLANFTMDTTSQPDFGPTGGTMYFGLAYVSLTGVPSGFTWTTYFGRFEVSLHDTASVPEIDPGTSGTVMALLVGATGLLEGRRRRRSRSAA